MKVKVRGGYSISVNGTVYKEHQVFEISEADYKMRHWVFEVVQDKAVEATKVEPVVTVGAVATEDVLNTAIASPIVRRGRVGRGK